MYDFALHRPASVTDAVGLYANAASAFYLAGGQTLIPTLKHRLAGPSDVVDLAAIPGLRGIEVRARALRIGAMQCHSSIAESPIVCEHLPALAALAGEIGDQMVRNRGTLGGSVANNDPAADYPAAVLGLGATVRTDRRGIPADEFFVGMFETALQPAEMIVTVEFPLPDAAVYLKAPHPTSGYALVGVFIARFGTRVRIAITGAGPCVHRVPALEDALTRSFGAGALALWKPDAGSLNRDMHASAEFRAQLLKVMTRRAVTAMVEGQRR
jgi:carbon-monoxide dehydrogenase medium subunit